MIGYCECGWPLLPDGTCSDAECPLGWQAQYQGSWDVGLAQEVETLVNKLVGIFPLDHPASIRTDPQKHHENQREWQRNKIREIVTDWLDRHALSLKSKSMQRNPQPPGGKE